MRDRILLACREYPLSDLVGRVFDELRIEELGGYNLYVFKIAGVPFAFIARRDEVKSIADIAYAANPGDNDAMRAEKELARRLLSIVREHADECDPCEVATDLVFLLDMVGCDVGEDDDVKCLSDDEIVVELVGEYEYYREMCG